MNQLPNKYSFKISFPYAGKQLSYQVDAEKLSHYRESFAVHGKNQDLIFEGSRPAKRHSDSYEQDWVFRLLKGTSSNPDFMHLLEISIRKEVRRLEEMPQQKTE